MTTLIGPEIRRTGEAIAHAAPELLRVWRAARLETRPTAFPGLADGVVESLVAAVGEALVTGRAPEGAWSRVEGIVRLDRASDGQAEGELLAEGRLLAELLASACEALDTGPAVAEEVARAAESAARGLLDLRDGPRRTGWWWSGSSRPSDRVSTHDAEELIQLERLLDVVLGVEVPHRAER